ncbi:transcriptional regulator [Bacillus inaquosorum]|uniref:LexA family protein n=1 Tax=Bacillus inaquosorum TaxID=483913 RepID=UPI000A11D8A4|nr:transcriptional regulator [Bacillus inaquosorum]QYX42700.1 transcriptional regulator [Bacillus inaquosorum]WNW23168.1 transcriptional regulator [Bacillus inaquosorum]
MRKITERQYETLQVIEKYINEKGFAPTYRELMNMLGLTSPSTVKGLLDALKRKLNKEPIVIDGFFWL